MADILLDVEAGSSMTTAAGQGGLFFDSTTGLCFTKDANGIYYGVTDNAAVTNQTVNAADTYLTNSDILIPSFGPQAKTRIKWIMSASKTGAGTAGPIYTIRTGSLRTTGDTSRLALTGPLQTAVADIGTLTVIVTVRNVGAAAVLQGTAWWDHRGTAASTTTSGTGFANDSTGHVDGTSASFDSTTLAGTYFGLSVNSGTSGVWTVTQVWVEVFW